MTRYERIKNMTLEEMVDLVKWLEDKYLGGLYCKSDCGCDYGENERACIARWLNGEE